MRKAITLLGLLALVGSLLASRWRRRRRPEKYRVYVFTAGAPASPKGVKAIRDLGKANGFGVQSNGDSGLVHRGDPAASGGRLPDGARQPLNAAQEAAFEAYFRTGGGYVGIGPAVETEPGVAIPHGILGTRSAGKLGAQIVTNKVADRSHDASKNLPENWNLNDTCYNSTPTSAA